MKPIKIYKDESLGPSYFVVDWMLHNRCTYDCSYCPPGNKSGTDSWLKLDVVTEFCEQLEKHVAQVAPTSKIHCWFTGGEPTVWKDFSKLVDILSARGWYLSVNSNGSRSARWWEEHASKFNTITLSYHTEGVEDDDEFLEKVAICEQHTKVGVNVMLNPNLVWFRKAVNFGERLEQAVPNAGVVYRKIQHNFGLQEIKVSEYDQAQLEKMLTLTNRSPSNRHNKTHDNWVVKFNDGRITRCNGENLTRDNLANFWGWKCNIGLDSVFVDARGDLSRGTCRVDGKFGNILKPEEIQWPVGSVKCPYTWCGCITDILNEKEAP